MLLQYQKNPASTTSKCLQYIATTIMLLLRSLTLLVEQQERHPACK